MIHCPFVVFPGDRVPPWNRAKAETKKKTYLEGSGLEDSLVDAGAPKGGGGSFKKTL